MEGFEKFVITELLDNNYQLIHQLRKTKKEAANANKIMGLIIAILGYSVYAQACKIESLTKKVNELNS